MYPLFQTISTDYFESNFNNSFKDFLTDLPRFELPVYNLLCAGNYNYQIPFEAIKFELSDNLTIEVLQDNNDLLSQCSITKVNQNQGYFEFSCKDRFSNDLSNIRLLISDQDNGFITTFGIWRGCDSLSSVDFYDYSLDENTGIISLSFIPDGLPRQYTTFWSVAKPDIVFTDENDQKVDVLFPKKPEFSKYAIMNRYDMSYLRQKVFAILNTSFKGNLICTWTDTITGVSTQKSIPVDYTKV